MAGRRLRDSEPDDLWSYSYWFYPLGSPNFWRPATLVQADSCSLVTNGDTLIAVGGRAARHAPGSGRSDRRRDRPRGPRLRAPYGGPLRRDRALRRAGRAEPLRRPAGRAGAARVR